jgi:hypothetical protein
MAGVTSIFTNKLENSAMINRLFVYADNWHRKALKSLVLGGEVKMDMTGTGGQKPARMRAEKICWRWETGFTGYKEGYYLKEDKQNGVSVVFNSNTSSFKSSFSKGKTRTFVGSHKIHLIRLESGWKTEEFTYHMKYAQNMMTLK